MFPTKNKAMKTIRKAAKAKGLVFKPTDTRLNGALLYKLVDKKTGDVMVDNYLFWSAFYVATEGNGFESRAEMRTRVYGD